MMPSLCLQTTASSSEHRPSVAAIKLVIRSRVVIGIICGLEENRVIVLLIRVFENYLPRYGWSLCSRTERSTTRGGWRRKRDVVASFSNRLLQQRL